MIKKLILFISILLIPILGGMFGFYAGNSKITVSASESQDKKNDDIPLKGKSLSDSERTIREIVWKKIRPSGTIHGFKHTKDNELFVQAGFTNLNKDLKKTVKLIKEVKSKCNEIVDYYNISFIGKDNKELIKIEFDSEILSQINFDDFKVADIEPMATNYFIDESLILNE